MTPVSAYTGAGLDDLKSMIDDILNDTETRRDLGRPRLPIDRCFTVSGFGTVITGTLIDGSVAVGQQIELAPSGRQARIRGLQSHKSRLERGVARRAIGAEPVGHFPRRRHARRGAHQPGLAAAHPPLRRQPADGEGRAPRPEAQRGCDLPPVHQRDHRGGCASWTQTGCNRAAKGGCRCCWTTRCRW